MEEFQNKSMNSNKKYLRRIATFLVVVLLAVGVFFLTKWIVRQMKEKAGIKVGDTFISKKDIDENTKGLTQYLADNPDMSYGKGSPEEIAKNDLILNAALKDYSKQKCTNKTFSNLDLYKALNYTEDNLSEDKAKEIVDENLANKGNFERIRLENEAMKKNLHSCIVKVKELYSVSIIFDSFYFLGSSSQTEFDQKIATAKKKLEDTFMEKFKAGVSRDELDKLVDVGYNIRFNTYIEEYDYTRNPTVYSNLMRWTKDEGGEKTTIFNDIKKSNYAGHTLPTISMNQLVDSMDTVGEVKGVNVGQDGELSIIRLESINGDFDDWNAFLNHYKQKSNGLSYSGNIAYAYEGWSSTGSIDGFEFTITGQGGLGPGWKVFTADEFCKQGGVAHNVLLTYKIKVEGKTGLLSKAGVVHASARQTLRRTDRSWAHCAANSDDDNNSEGKVRAVYNCSQGGDFRGTNSTLTVTINDAYKEQYKVVVNPTPAVPYSSNNVIQYVTDPIVIKENISPPPDKNYNPIQNNTTNTQVSIDYSSWKSGSGHIATVGQSIRFKHEVYANVSGGSEWDSASLSWSTLKGRSGNESLRLPQRGLAYTRTESSYTIRNSDAGSVICDSITGRVTNRRYRAKGVVKNNIQTWEPEYVRSITTTDTSIQACVYVPYDFELTPCIKGGGAICGGVDIPVEPGGSTPNTPTVKNNGTPTPNNSKYIITTWKVQGSSEGIRTPTNQEDNTNSNTCVHYSLKFNFQTRECTTQSGERSFPPSTTTTLYGSIPPIPENAELGSRYCIALSVSPYKMSPNENRETQQNKIGREWRHSAPLCLKVTKKPKLQVWGNGIYSRGGIITSRSSLKGSVFGSWVEYEAIAGGKVSGFASESSTTGNRLTFANDKSTTKGSWGNWTGATETNRIISNIRGRYPRSRDGVIRETRDGTYGGHNGNLTPDIHTRIIDSKGMFLTGNIISRNPMGTRKINAFQQTIIIVEGDLYIHKDVTQIDAWLIVKGKIVTCATTQSENSAIVNNYNCGKSLQINGPIIANNLKSWRTGGSEFANPGTPSEIYNQRADVYLWAYAQGTTHNKVVTTYTKELPVRY